MLDHLTQKRMLADAMRIVVQDLDLSIQQVRCALKKGQQVQKRAQTYLRLLKMAHGYRMDAEDLDCKGPLFTIIEPLPFRTGFVGHTREQVKALEWKVL